MESPTTKLAPPLEPLLALIRNLVAAAAQAPTTRQRPVRVHSVQALPDGLALEIEARGLNVLVDGGYRVEVAILRTCRESTLCDVRVVQGRVAGTLLNWSLKLLPNSVLNALLRGHAGGALSMEGDRVLVDHQALIAWLLRKQER
jgi:hypothetical protein